MKHSIALVLTLALGISPCLSNANGEIYLPRHLGPFELGATVAEVRSLGFAVEWEYSIGCPELLVAYNERVKSPVNFSPMYGVNLIVDGESESSRVLSIQAYVSNAETRRVFDEFVQLYGRPRAIDDYTFSGEQPSKGYVDKLTVIQIPSRPLTGDSVIISDRSYRVICDNDREYEGTPKPDDFLDQ
jgi:hypothetical protein